MAAATSSTQDGKLHVDDPQVKEAVIKALDYPTSAYKEGFVPPSAINWNDADDNNAFHAKMIVMDLDGTISTEVAIYQRKKEDYDDIVDDGPGARATTASQCRARSTTRTGLIPKGAKNVEVAKDFLKYFIQPEVINEWLKTGLGRKVPAMPSIVKNDPWWLARPAPQGLCRAGRARPDRAAILRVQPGLCPGPERAHLDAPAGWTSS